MDQRSCGVSRLLFSLRAIRCINDLLMKRSAQPPDVRNRVPGSVGRLPLRNGLINNIAIAVAAVTDANVCPHHLKVR